MRQMKGLTPLILIFAIIFVLSACGSGLEKPTGLEEPENEQANDNVEIGLIDEEQVADETNEEVDQVEEASPSNDEGLTSEAESEITESADNKAAEKDTTQKNTNAPKTDKNVKKDSKSTKSKKETKKKTEKQKTEDKTKSSTAKPNTPPPKKETESKAPKASKPSTPEPKEKKNTVTISIVVSSSEVILQPTEYEIQDGENALKALSDITREQNIPREILSSGYVKGIGGVSEEDRGEVGGWMYRVNGAFPTIGARSYILEAGNPGNPGDRVEWLYTLDGGKDIGAR